MSISTDRQAAPMSTKQARTRATAAWRARTGAKLVQAYLHTDTLVKLDAMVKARGASGRAAVLTELIEATREPLSASARPVPAVSTPTRAWKLTKSKADGWQWDVLVGGKVVGRMNPPALRAGDWAGESAALPGAEHRRYRRTRAELAALLVELAG